MKLRDNLLNEVKDNISYIKKMREWLKKHNSKEFNTNLHDLEKEDDVYIYSCLNANTEPDKLSLEDFDRLLQDWIVNIKNKR